MSPPEGGIDAVAFGREQDSITFPGWAGTHERSPSSIKPELQEYHAVVP
jgi:hypothetical protein